MKFISRLNARTVTFAIFQITLKALVSDVLMFGFFFHFGHDVRKTNHFKVTVTEAVASPKTNVVKNSGKQYIIKFGGF